MREHGVIELIADRESYEVGDIAQVLVPAPYTGATGLVTLERGGVLSTEVRRFETNSDVLSIPDEDWHIPNIYVGVVLYRPPTDDDPFRANTWAMSNCRSPRSRAGSMSASSPTVALPCPASPSTTTCSSPMQMG